MVDHKTSNRECQVGGRHCIRGQWYRGSCRSHRRIQDFVRGGAKALLAPGGGGGAKALLARASLFGGAIFCGEGGGPRPPWPPPGSAHGRSRD